MRPAKTQISLGIPSESSLSAWRKLGSLATHWAHSEDSDQTGRMPRLIWVFAGRACHFVGFVMRRLIYSSTTSFEHSGAKVGIKTSGTLRTSSGMYSLINHQTSHEYFEFMEDILAIEKAMHRNDMSRDMTKPTKWLCAQRRLRSDWASAQSNQSLICLHEETLGP